MSIEAISWVINQNIPDGVAKLVAMVLADYAKAAYAVAREPEGIGRACPVQRPKRKIHDL